MESNGEKGHITLPEPSHLPYISATTRLSRRTAVDLRAHRFSQSSCTALAGRSLGVTTAIERNPDQWFLAQSCLLQILDVIVIYKTTLIRFNTRLWVLMLGSAAFSTAALIVYVRSPTRCSALVACIGGALQHVVILQSMFAVGGAQSQGPVVLSTPFL